VAYLHSKKALKESKTFHASWDQDSLCLPVMNMRTGGTSSLAGKKKKNNPGQTVQKKLKGPPKKEGLFYH